MAQNKKSIQPENGNESINPIGSENKTAPNAASFKPSFACTVAIRDAQLAKQSPAIKNMAPTAMGRTVRDAIAGFMEVSIIDFLNLVYF